MLFIIVDLYIYYDKFPADGSKVEEGAGLGAGGIHRPLISPLISRVFIPLTSHHQGPPCSWHSHAKMAEDVGPSSRSSVWLKG